MPISETRIVEVSQGITPKSNRLRSTTLGISRAVEKFKVRYGREPEWDSVTITVNHVTWRAVVELEENL